VGSNPAGRAKFKPKALSALRDRYATVYPQISRRRISRIHAHHGDGPAALQNMIRKADQSVDIGARIAFRHRPPGMAEEGAVLL
jgi:hypothetical protein